MARPVGHVVVYSYFIIIVVAAIVLFNNNNNKSCLYPAIDDISHYHDGTAYRIYQFTITIYQFLHTVFTNQPDKEVEIQR